eukprot:scaffold74943_cov24-Tisochrysis_lutea.AAC.1
MPKGKGLEWDYLAMPDAEPGAKGERAHACAYQLALARGPACSWGRLSLGWLRMREGEERRGQHAARGGARGGKHGFTGVEGDTQ